MTNRRLTLTTESGAPVADNRNTPTAGPAGPVLPADQHLIEAQVTCSPIGDAIVGWIGRRGRGRAGRVQCSPLGDGIVARSIDHFRKADATYGSRVEEAVAAARI